MAKQKVTISLDPAVMAAAEDARWSERMSFSAYVERAVREYLERNPPPKR